MDSNPFDDLRDLTPSGTIKRPLPHAFVHSKKPLVLELRLAHVAWNKEYAELRTAYNAVHAQKAKAERRPLWNAMMADTVVVGWENCNSKDGSPLTYTPALAKQLLAQLDKNGLEDEVDDAYIAAMDIDNFRASPAAIVESMGK